MVSFFVRRLRAVSSQYSTDPVEMSIKNEMTHFKNVNRYAERLLQQHFPSIL